ncbi:MAG: type II toxin-antitoxin system HipA family toxin [Betaproteobacteria bacterium]|nr:type II toxin-antitoxin system HipA family toxin [Betaproteobacteria bacterium]
MTDRHALSVFDANICIGTVAYEALDERFSFEYANEWRDFEGAYPLSPHFPLAGGDAVQGSVRRFIENLLPEGRALDIVSLTYQVARNNVFGLIRELGRETAGALSFLPVGESPETQQTTCREITRDELARRIAGRAQLPFSVWDGRMRMSIAGYQDKLPVFIDDEGRLYLVEGQLASTHILKPEPALDNLPMLVANEHYCMGLAKRLGLPVANTTLMRVPEPVLAVERFDRVKSAGRVARLHIIDACQALNLPVAYKYERNFGSGRDVRHIRDGVSFESLFSISEHTIRKASTRQMLARWALFQYLIGNCDAHGKNLSFFCLGDGLAMAPFYDLVSVVQYPGLDHELSMAFGDEFRLDDVSSFAWADFARRTALQRPFLGREMKRLARAAQAAAGAQAAMPDYEGAERDFVQRIEATVKAQAEKLLAAISPMLAIDAALLGPGAAA